LPKPGAGKVNFSHELLQKRQGSKMSRVGEIKMKILN
jgi:hypothetical protein